MKNCFVIAVTAALAFSSLSSICQTTVDLGLPSGTLWASCNLGGTNAWDYGDYYAWGETSLHYSDLNIGSAVFTWKTGFEDGFTWDTYKYATNRYTGLTKYCSSAAYGKAGYTDALTSLQPVDDAALAVWGDDWVIPTYKEWSELSKNCYWEWTENYNSKGKKGYIVYKTKNDKDKGIKNILYDQNRKLKYKTTESYSLSDTHIFLPASGGCVGNSLSRRNSYGYYWTASLYNVSPCFARVVLFDNTSVSACQFSYEITDLSDRSKKKTIIENDNISRRYDGQSIRPVKRP